MLGGILFGEGHSQFAIPDIGDVERGKAGRDGAVLERASAERVRGKCAIEHVHRAVAEVGHIKVVGASRRCQSNSFIDSIATTAVVNHETCARARVPSGDGSVLPCEEEVCRGADNLEVCRAVKYLSRRGSCVYPVSRRNSDDQTLGISCCIVKGGKAW